MAIAEKIGILRRFIPGRREPRLAPDITAEQVKARREFFEKGQAKYTVERELIVPNRLYAGEFAEVFVYTSKSDEGWRAVAVDRDRKSETPRIVLGEARFSADSIEEAGLVTDEWMQNSAATAGRNGIPVNEQIGSKYAQTIYRVGRI